MTSRKRGYDEIGDHARILVDGDPPDADCDSYGAPFTPEPPDEDDE